MHKIAAALLFVGSIACIASSSFSSAEVSAARAQRRSDTGTAAREMMVANGEARIHVKIAGEGHTVVVLPSLGRSVEDFRDLGARLAANGYRVLMPEPRGIGKSVGPTHKLTLHDLAGDVAAVIRAAGKAPATVIGHAFGNRIARAAATNHPELVNRVVLIAAGGYKPIEPEIRQALMNCFNEELPRKDRLAAIKLAFFADGNDPALWESGWFRDVAAYQTEANTATPASEWLAGGRAKILVLQGAEDTVAPPENSEHLLKEYGDRVRVIEIQKAGHALLPEQPEAIAKAILDFFYR